MGRHVLQNRYRIRSSIAMLIRFFKGTGPDVVASIGLLSLAVWAVALINPLQAPVFIPDLRPMPLYSLLKPLNDLSPAIGAIFSLSLVLLISYLLVSFNTALMFISERTFLPSVFYVLLSGFIPATQALSPVLPASVLLMIAMRRIMDAYRKNETAYNFFDAAFLISTGSLFYANMIWFSLLPFIGIAILRTGNIRELFLAFIGMITPLLLVTAIYYVTGKEMELLFSDALYNLFGDSPGIVYSRVLIAGLIFTGMILLVSLVHLFSLLDIKKIRSRKTFSMLIWVFVISLAVVFAVPSASAEIIYLMIIPVSYILAHYFLYIKRKVMAELLFSLIFLVIALIQVLAGINN